MKGFSGHSTSENMNNLKWPAVNFNKPVKNVHSFGDETACDLENFGMAQNNIDVDATEGEFKSEKMALYTVVLQPKNSSVVDQCHPDASPVSTEQAKIINNGLPGGSPYKVKINESIGPFMNFCYILPWLCCW